MEYYKILTTNFQSKTESQTSSKSKQSYIPLVIVKVNMK